VACPQWYIERQLPTLSRTARQAMGVGCGGGGVKMNEVLRCVMVPIKVNKKIIAKPRGG